MEKLGVGIVGLGQVARVRHVEAYKRCENAEVVAAYDPNSEREVVAKQLNIPNFYTDLNSFYSNSNLKAVSICAPPMDHADMIKHALNQNRHVLVEKPITMDKVDQMSLETIAADKKLVFGTCHNFLFGKAMTRLSRIRNEKNLGDVVGATAIQWSSWNRRLPKWHPQLPGGLFFDEGPHLLYMIEHFIGDLSVDDAWYVQKILPNDREVSHFNVAFKGDSAFATINMWFGAPQSEWMLAVGFERGTAVIDLFRDILVFLPPEYKRDYRYILEIPLRSTIQQWISIFNWSVARIFKGRHLYGHQHIINSFVHAVQSDSKPEITSRDGFRILKVIEETLEKAGLK